MVFNRNDKGYTLIELIAVMAILALAAAITFPALAQPLVNAKLESDARQMASALRMARQEAITSGQPRTVIFYPGNDKYKILGQSTYYLKSGINYVGDTTFTMRSGGKPACAFSPSGAPSSGGTVTLQSQAGRLYIIVNPVAGRVRISDSPPTSW